MILDVAGHGISAALLTGVVKMSLHRRLAEHTGLPEAVAAVNRDLLGCLSDGQFVSLCVAVWSHSDGSWAWCGAGHAAGNRPTID